MRWSVQRTSSCCENAANVFLWDNITRDMNHPQCAIHNKSQEKPPCRMCVTKKEVMPFDALTSSLWPFYKRAHFFPSLILLWDKARVEVIFFSVAFLHTYRRISAYDDANRTYSEQALFCNPLQIGFFLKGLFGGGKIVLWHIGWEGILGPSKLK